MKNILIAFGLLFLTPSFAGTIITSQQYYQQLKKAQDLPLDCEVYLYDGGMTKSDHTVFTVDPPNGESIDGRMVFSIAGRTIAKSFRISTFYENTSTYGPWFRVEDDLTSTEYSGKESTHTSVIIAFTKPGYSDHKGRLSVKNTTPYLSINATCYW